ncbi:MAG TPA: sterol desaturase family protein [Planctomycetaceae bacterium]|nr:sterol desaturase family protein [Planctomycetaceae bacterium]
MPAPVEIPEAVLGARLVLPVVLLAVFWLWETWHPFFGLREGRLRHAGHNLALALGNTVVLAFTAGAATVAVCAWTAHNGWGLLSVWPLAGPVRFALALVLLDAWMYVWHRANHAVPLLWRFHRMHHSDNRMDVTTATRFHLGEHLGGATLRLGLIPLVGFQIWHIVVYELLVVAITQFHHADVSLGRLDRWLRLVIVTPDMHKMHHSRWRPETDSNYSTVLSVWDRLARTFRMRPDPRTLVFGLDEFDDGRWQTVWGMLKTPFTRTGAGAPGDPPNDSESDRTPAVTGGSENTGRSLGHAVPDRSSLLDPAAR